MNASLFQPKVAIQSIIDAFGGPTALGRELGRSAQCVVNWRNAGRFPPTLYDRMNPMVKKRGIRAPKSLWGQE